MKQPFDYDVWKNHPDRDKIKIYSNGIQVFRLTDFSDLTTDSDYVLLGYADGSIESWKKTGKYCHTGNSKHDLKIELPEEPEFYVLANLEGSFLDRQIVNAIYTSKETVEFAKGISENQSYKIYKLVKQ